MKEIEKFGIEAKGRRNLIRHLQGERLTMKKAIHAKCYDCMGYYSDGKRECGITECPLYNYMPYKADEETRPKRERTDRQISSAERLALIRSAARRKEGL